MPLIANIPEPTTGFRPVPVEAAGHSPLGMRPILSAHETDRRDEATESNVLAWLTVFTGGGLMLRLMLFYFGPWREVGDAAAQWVGLGATLMRDPAAAGSAWPGFAVLASSADQIGLPSWAVVLLGLLLTVAAIPAGYTLGHRLTDSPITGLVTAALLAFHPAALTAAGLYGPESYALSVVTLGLALVAISPQRGTLCALMGAALVGLAAITAPLVWTAIPVAGLLAAKAKPIRTALLRAGLVLLIALAPAATWHATTGDLALAPPHADTEASAVARAGHTPLNEQLLYAASNHSLPKLGAMLHAEIIGDGPLTRTLNPTLTGQAAADPVADTIGDGWVVLNLLMLLAAGASAGLLAARRRWVTAGALLLPLAVLMLGSPMLGEPGRVVVLCLQGVLVGGMFAARAVPRLSEQERADLAAQQLAKREAKDQAKLAKAEQKARTDIYAFDRGARQGKTDRRTDVSRVGDDDRRAEPTQPPILITTERTIEPEMPMGRPI